MDDADSIIDGLLAYITHLVEQTKVLEARIDKLIEELESGKHRLD